MCWLDEKFIQNICTHHWKLYSQIINKHWHIITMKPPKKNRSCKHDGNKMENQDASSKQRFNKTRVHICIQQASLTTEHIAIQQSQISMYSASLLFYISSLTFKGFSRTTKPANLDPDHMARIHPLPVLHDTRFNSTHEQCCKFTSIYWPPCNICRHITHQHHHTNM
jgi:hypothetical protein